MTDNSIGLWGKGNTSPEKQTIQTYVCHISVFQYTYWMVIIDKRHNINIAREKRNHRHTSMQTNEDYTFLIVKAAWVKMLFLQAQ